MIREGDIVLYNSINATNLFVHRNITVSGQVVPFVINTGSLENYPLSYHSGIKISDTNATKLYRWTKKIS